MNFYDGIVIFISSIQHIDLHPCRLVPAWNYMLLRRMVSAIASG